MKVCLYCILQSTLPVISKSNVHFYWFGTINNYCMTLSMLSTIIKPMFTLSAEVKDEAYNINNARG